LAALAVATDIDSQPGVVVTKTTLGSHPREILHGGEGGASRADEQTKVVASDTGLEVVSVGNDRGAAIETERLHQSVEEPHSFLTHLFCAHCVLLCRLL
jgi:hypothetical protein